jgi:hypothetical protein
MSKAKEILEHLNKFNEMSEYELAKGGLQLIQDDFNDLENIFNQGYTWEDMIQDEDLYNNIIYSEAGINQAMYDIKKYIHDHFNKMGIPTKFIGVPFAEAEKENFGKKEEI